MAILSKRMMTQVGRIYYEQFGIRPHFINLSGQILNEDDILETVGNSKRRRNYALQESINRGVPYLYSPVPGLSAWMVGLEDRRMVLGGAVGGVIAVSEFDQALDQSYNYLISNGLKEYDAIKFLNALPTWSMDRAGRAADFLQQTFYQVSGWNPELMQENRLRILRQEQLNQAIEDQKKQGSAALYAFEKERVLLSNIRAGDRNEARRILNEMLATIYMSSPQLVVLRARTVELMSCLTRERYAGGTRIRRSNWEVRGFAGATA